MALELRADTIENAIKYALKYQEWVHVEWYSLGKTREDFLAYLKEKGINQKELGVFIAGNRDENPNQCLVVMPRSFIVEDDSVPCR